MIRKITFLFLLSIGIHSIVNAQVTETVSISIPPYTDTTCPGSQLTFTAVQSIDTFSTTTYHWFVNNVFTGVIIDTFYTTAPVDGDSVYCEIYYTNSAGLDSAKSNTIIIHRSPSIAPGVVIALTAGSNPYCSITPLTFTAFPINGGTSPVYQWMVDGSPLLGEDSSTITWTFSFGDTVSCRVISNSSCSAPYNDTVYSVGVPIVHDSLTAEVSVIATKNPICAGTIDTFIATIVSPGSGYVITWYVDTNTVPSAIGPMYITDTLHNGELVYCVLTAPDPCIVNHTTVSNIITMTVIPNLPNSVWTVLTAGSNPGCLDSLVQFTGHYTNFGIAPTLTWYVNSVAVATGTTLLDQTFADGDTVTFRVYATDHGCYAHDTLSSTPYLMIRDSTPVAPLVSLIGDLLVANSGGSYKWYFDSVLVPGAIGQTYHPGQLGFYYAVKDTGNCPSVASNVIYISLLGVNSINRADVTIFPNPTSGLLNIGWGRQVEHMGVDVFNIMGQGLIHQDVTNDSHLETDISYLPEGNYYVVLSGQDGSKVTFKVTLAK